MIQPAPYGSRAFLLALLLSLKEIRMACIYREITVAVPAHFAWEAVKDVGAVHTRLARGFVTATELQDGERTVTFANGFQVRERIVDVNDELRRLSYSAVGGRTTHHNASVQVFAIDEGHSRLLWITDLLPDEIRPAIAQMVEYGAQAIKQTLEAAYAE
jgi:carbon monoxide dehydrogenase subunit G